MGKYNNAIKKLTLVVRQAFLSGWGYNTVTEFSALAGQESWFISGQLVGGPVNTNGYLDRANHIFPFNIWGSPVFTGRVTQVGPTINYYHADSNPLNHPNDPTPLDNPVWKGGLVPGTPAIYTQDPSNPNEMIDNIIGQASSTRPFVGEGVNGPVDLPNATFTGDTDIELLNTAPVSQIRITNANLNLDPNDNHPIPFIITMPANKTLFVNAAGNGSTQNTNAMVTVHGTLNGALTIGSDADIFVTDNTTYHDYGPSMTNADGSFKTGYNANSTDMLGLVAQNNVIIAAYGAPGNSDLRNIEIDAYIVAMQGAFYVQDYNSSLHGTFIQFGGETTHDARMKGVFDPGRSTIVDVNNPHGAMVAGYMGLFPYDERLGGAVPITPPGFMPAKDASGRVVYSKVQFNEPFSRQSMRGIIRL